MKTKLSLLLLAAALPILSSAIEPMRTFTDVTGRTTQATFVSVSGDDVTLQLASGQQATLKVSRFSVADQQYFASKKAAPAKSAAAADSSKYGGMALPDGWMPQRNETKRELLEGITFYAKAVLGDAVPGNEPIPGELSSNITWLMPFDQALAKLPERVIKMGERAVNNNAFPASCLTIASFQYKSFQDQGKPFNLIHLILDAKRQVVGVQFVQQTPGKNFLYEAEGKLEPYYNFLTLTNNASTGKEVVYAILPGQSKGVKCIQTVFRDVDNNIANGLPQIPGQPGRGMPPGMPMVNRVTPGAMGGIVKVYEVCHWYLAAPFARCLVEIAEKNGVRSN